ncbi:hypothetical protein QJS10_CPA03g02413 [Acorus calamus]|uniref:Uncharacterized protein n=1 Tax=Acorus calamus TaxID=4465 RepID=A0AAV9F8M2_ACOCL|nr:hypothetical protein QJS10_CPA03g02413 [Acorus calamus]
MSIFHRNKSSISRSLSHRFETLTSVLLRKPGRPFSGEAVIVNGEMDSVVGEPKEGCVDVSKWKAVNALDFGVRRSDIPPFPWTVIDKLRKKGFDAYLVGGCVRDLLLKKIPKDFDVVTTANLNQVKKVFSRSLIVGKKFPICHVRGQGFLVEVSSFDTSQSIAKENGTKSLDTPSGCNKKDIVRWRDSMLRDFTINGLYYDPFANRIYDYVSGIRDIKLCKLRTIIPAHLFLEKQGANVLRGIRIAARLGLEISEETAAAIKLLAPSVSSIVKVRLIMEMNYMMAYGAAVSSINLLQKFKVLDILLPIQATYLAQQARKNFSQNSTMLMKLFSSVDKLLAPNCPSDGILWVAVLAFHLALVNHPQDAFVVWTFASILFHGSWTKAVESVKNVQTQPQFSPEILESSVTRSDECLEEKVQDLASLVISSMDVFACKDALRQYMIKHPDCPSSGLVFTSKNACDKVARLLAFSRLISAHMPVSGRRTTSITGCWQRGM